MILEKDDPDYIKPKNRAGLLVGHWSLDDLQIRGSGSTYRGVMVWWTAWTGSYLPSPPPSRASLTRVTAEDR